jgi:hypothetical protein
VGAASSFSARINGQQVQTASMPGVTGNFLDAFAAASTQRSNALVAQSSLGLAFTYSPTASGAQGWLNWFELHGRRNLSVAANTALFFRDWQSVATNAVAGFTIANNGTALTVWDITDPLQPAKMNATANASQTNFSNDASRLREYVAFALSGTISPSQ